MSTAAVPVSSTGPPSPAAGSDRFRAIWRLNYQPCRRGRVQIAGQGRSSVAPAAGRGHHPMLGLRGAALLLVPDGARMASAQLADLRRPAASAIGCRSSACIPLDRIAGCGHRRRRLVVAHFPQQGRVAVASVPARGRSSRQRGPRLAPFPCAATSAKVAPTRIAWLCKQERTAARRRSAGSRCRGAVTSTSRASLIGSGIGGTSTEAVEVVWPCRPRGIRPWRRCPSGTGTAIPARDRLPRGAAIQDQVAIAPSRREKRALNSGPHDLRLDDRDRIGLEWTLIADRRSACFRFSRRPGRNGDLAHAQWTPASVRLCRLHLRALAASPHRPLDGGPWYRGAVVLALPAYERLRRQIRSWTVRVHGSGCAENYCVACGARCRSQSKYRAKSSADLAPTCPRAAASAVSKPPMPQATTGKAVAPQRSPCPGGDRTSSASRPPHLVLSPCTRTIAGQGGKARTLRSSSGRRRALSAPSSFRACGLGPPRLGLRHASMGLGEQAVESGPDEPRHQFRPAVHSPSRSVGGGEWGVRSASIWRPGRSSPSFQRIVVDAGFSASPARIALCIGAAPAPARVAASHGCLCTRTGLEERLAGWGRRTTPAASMVRAPRRPALPLRA